MPEVVVVMICGAFLLLFVAAALQSPVVEGIVVLLSRPLISAVPHCDSGSLTLR